MNSLRLRIRQFGMYSAFSQIMRAALRGMYRVEQHLVFIIPGFKPPVFCDSSIVPLTAERIAQASNVGELSAKEAKALKGFLDNGCLGLCAEFDGRLAGYAWLQFTGEYRFGHAGRMSIPPKHVVLNNLLVFPDYRGHGLGNKLVLARLARIPSEWHPETFIIPENRSSIKNCENQGFQRILHIKCWKWFRGPWHMRIERLKNSPEAIELENALKKGNPNL